MTREPQTYFHSDAYWRTVDALEAIAASFALDPGLLMDTRTQIVEILGDLGAWPMCAYTGEDEGKVIVVA